MQVCWRLQNVSVVAHKALLYIATHKSNRFSSIIASSPEYEWIGGVERLERYHAMGYHPADIGDMLHERYEIVDKLGYRGWSSWK